MRKRSKLVWVCGFLALAVPCHADLVVANGAGPLPASAQDLSGDPNLTEIAGSISDPLGVNTFLIDILDFQNFSALAVPVGAFGIPDTELFLFNQAGLGVYGNDDISGLDTLSCLPSQNSGSNPCATTSGGLGPTSDGLYYLAITRSANSPEDVNGLDNFNPGSSTSVVGPDSSAGAVAQYDGGVFTSPNFDQVNYDIVLTGTSPEPSTWLLMISAGALLVLLGKRLSVMQAAIGRFARNRP